MIIVNYLNKFRLLLYASLILCGILLGGEYWGGVLQVDWSSVGLGSLNDNETLSSNAKYVYSRDPEDVRISEIYPNCGLRMACPQDTFAVHVYTGRDKDDQPKLCVQGRYLAGGGRGLNFAIVEPRHLQIVALQNFDLYSQNSTALENWLSAGIKTNDIVIGFTFDEASKELSKYAKELLFNLGSGKIQDLQYRSQWYMISQKGINGFTPLETITYARNDRWGDAIEERLCVPRRIKPLPVSPDPPPRHNPAREALCSTSAELRCEPWCGPLARHEPIYPSLLTNRSLIANVALSTPVLVIAPQSMSTLVLTLSTLVAQPGIHCPTVYVLHTDDQVKVPSVTKVFGLQALLCNETSSNPNYKMMYGLRFIRNSFPKKKYAIVLEEGLILSPDFLFYMAQIAPLLEIDPSILGISAWNPYGYRGVSSEMSSTAYRAEDFPGYGFLMKISVFSDVILPRMDECCTAPTFKGWPSILRLFPGRHIIVPDLSRVLRRPKDISTEDERLVFSLERATNVGINAHIASPEDLLADNYDNRLIEILSTSITIHLTEEDLRLCDQRANIAVKVMLAELKNKVFSVYYDEEDASLLGTSDCGIEYARLRAHMKCFELHLPTGWRPQFLYNKVARFTFGTNKVFLIEATSPFAKKRRIG